MEEMKINTAITGAKQCLLDDTNLIPVEQPSILLNKPQASQTSFHREDTLAVSEELPRDKPEKALCEVQSALFIHAGAPIVSSETLLLPKETVNGPVSHSTLPTSSVNNSSVSLTAGQAAGQHTDHSPSLNIENELFQPPTNQSHPLDHALFSLPDVAHANNLSHSINKLPTSDSLVDFEMQKDAGNSSNADSSLTPQIELCQETKSSLVKEVGVNVTGVFEATDVSRSGNDDSSLDPQKECMLLRRTDEATETPPINCTVRTEKKRKRKMDVSKITRYYPEDSYNDVNDSPTRPTLLDVERLDEPQIVVPHNYSLINVKSEPIFDESGASYLDETVDTIEDYMYSPVSRFSDDASPIHGNAFFSNSFNSIDQTFYKSTSSSDLEPSFYPCTKCNVNFREKKHLHRHMMYHLDGNNHFRHLNIPRPYACKECGRTFRDRNSLLKHMVIHQERRQKLMEEIRELKDLQDEGRSARLQCPQCVFGTNCPKTFVQHAKTHEKDKRYYCCEECNFMAVTENELECHRSIAHVVTVNSLLLSTEMSQRKAQRRLSEKSAYLLPSKKSTLFMCKLCSFTTSVRNILKKHMEYLHPASCMDQLDSHILENRESDITSELLDFGSQTKQFMKQSTFPKNSVLKQDLKRPFSPASQLSNFTKYHRKQYKIQKARKANAETEMHFPHSSPNKTLLVKNDQKRRYLNQMAKQKSDYELNSGYLYDQERERCSMSKNSSHPYYLNFTKEEGRSPSSVRLFNAQGHIQNNGVILDSHHSNPKKYNFSKDHQHVAVQGVRKIKREDPETEEDLGSYQDFLHKMTVVVLQKFDSSEKKDSYDTEDESSWDNGEQCDYASKFTEDEAYHNINQSRSHLYPLFKKQMNDQKADHEASMSTPHKDNFYFDYIDDTEDRFLHELNDGDHFENAETALPNSIFDWADLSLEKKNCPYCPAIFETGVGLSNHVRGHLHRAGLTYEARHVVSPHQIATSDKMQHFKRIGTPIKRIRKVIEKSESASEHTCQLCGGWFDTKIGLSNHVRGHLKRLGKTKWDAHKSPICVLNEMMQDEEKCEKIIKALNSRRTIHRSFAARKFASDNDLSATVLPPEAHHNGLRTEATSVKGLQVTHECDGKSDLYGESRNPSLTLIELLENKQMGDGTSPDNSLQKLHNQTARKRFNQKGILPLNDDCALMYQPHTAVDFSGMTAKLRTCVHCNTTFTSAVSLSNHLRAYARRRSSGLLTSSVIECKQKKSRSGCKKKGLQLPHSADEVYILRCRFCGLVFKGPLSVQEDWIKHLQRHIVNANLPRTGAGMVEVASLLKKPPSISETSFSLLMAEAAS